MKIKDIFAHFDKNDDGKITRAEWMDALEDLGIKINKEEAEAVLLHLDENHNFANEVFENGNDEVPKQDSKINAENEVPDVKLLMSLIMNAM